MKVRDLIEDFEDAGSATLVVQMPNGQKVPIKNYRWDQDARGETVIVFVTGKPPKK